MPDASSQTGVYRHKIDERTRTPTLWVRRKRGNKVLICSGCGGRCPKIDEIRQREVRDLPWRNRRDRGSGNKRKPSDTWRSVKYL